MTAHVLHNCRTIECIATRLAVLRRFRPVYHRRRAEHFVAMVCWASGKDMDYSVAFSMN